MKSKNNVVIIEFVAIYNRQLTKKIITFYIYISLIILFWCIVCLIDSINSLPSIYWIQINQSIWASSYSITKKYCNGKINDINAALTEWNPICKFINEFNQLNWMSSVWIGLNELWIKIDSNSVAALILRLM